MTQKVWAIGTRLVLAFVGIAAVRAAAEPPSLPILEKAIRDRRLNVPEFRYLQEQARRLGVRVWLFGGSAAALSHYVLRDLEGTTGDRGSSSEKLSYRYARIFRVTQDADLVIDGPEEAARVLESRLAQQFPHLLGAKKSAWETRLLREDMGDKEAPLTNPNFRGQNTDSHSTGMVEITEPPEGESVVRDVRDWGPGPGRFLQDVLARELHFYDAPTHGETQRAKDGLNPPIFSVIRYFTKAFQYGLRTRPEDEPALRRIIEEFDPARDLTTPYAQRWFEHHAKKLFWHANDVEYAWNELERVGLRRVLVRGPGPHAAGTLAWWLAKEPLRSLPIGAFAGPDDPRRAMAQDRPPGETARELGIDLVAHDTSDFLVYEILMASWDGHPNAFISRRDTEGEAAAGGSALYGRIGTVGGKFTDITVQMRLHPDAREGIDFVVDGTPHEGAQIRLFNRAALTLVRKDLEWDPFRYLAFVRGGGTFAQGEGGVRNRVRYELRHAVETLSTRELRRLVYETTAALDDITVTAEYFSEAARLIGRHLPVASRRRILERARNDVALAGVLLREVWGAMRRADIGPEELDGLAALLRTHGAAIFAAVADMLATEGWSEPRLWEVAYSSVLRAAQREPSEALVRQMWLREPWVERPDALPRLLEALELTDLVSAETIAHIGLHEEWANRPEAELLFRSLAERTNTASAKMFRLVMDREAWSHLAIEAVRGKVTREIAWAELEKETLELHRVWHDPIFQRELKERWEVWRRDPSTENREWYRKFVRFGLGHPGLLRRLDYLSWVDAVLEDSDQGRMDGYTRQALLSRYFASPEVSDVEGMDRRFLAFLRKYLERRRELFSITAFGNAVDRGRWFDRESGPAFVKFLADTLERFPSLLRGENGGAGSAHVKTWLAGPARRIPGTQSDWLRVEKALNVGGCTSVLAQESVPPTGIEPVIRD